MTVTQKNRPIQITTPLGEDVLLFYKMIGEETLSKLFEYNLDLLSLKDAINPNDILGETVTIKLQQADGAWRYFNGYVTRFAYYASLGNFTHYRATVRPWLWFLTRASNCRVFQHKSVPDIIKQVFRDQGFSEFIEKLSGSYNPRDYCVQYRESDFNFVSRLMEEEGIYYYFSHQDGKHDLVLSDSVSAHDKVSGYETIPFHQEQGENDRTRVDHIYAWEVGREVQSGFYALTDYDFKKPKAGLLVKSSVIRTHPHSKYECFDYPGEYVEMGDGEHLARARIEELQAQHEYCEGKGNPRGLAVGALFTLSEHARQNFNREHLVVHASYSLQLDEYISGSNSSRSEKLFECNFNAIDRTIPFRPPRMTSRPTVKGSQTAVVVGPSGEEIYVDKYGRVKVQFHWDRYGTNDENSSCWVRVSHPWAGKMWGMIAIPRIGQEVIVDFLEGDADQPIITGRVYNADQMPPYDLPANATQTGIKSRSSKGGGTANFNEIRFEDKKGSEEMYIHAEKDQIILVENDRGESIGRDRQLDVGRDKFEKIQRNKKILVISDHEESVNGNMTITVAHNLTETVALNYMETVGLAMELTVGGAMATSVGLAMAETVGASKSVSVGTSMSESIGSNKTIAIGKNLNEKIDENQSTTIGKDSTEQVGGKHRIEVAKEFMLQAKKVQITAADEISIKTGSAEIILKKNGDITVKGNKINIKGSSDVTIKGSNIKGN